MGGGEASDDVIVSLATTVPAVFPRLLHYGVSNVWTSIPLWLQCMHNVTEGGYIGSHCQPYDSDRSHVSVFDQFTYGTCSDKQLSAAVSQLLQIM